MAIKIKNISISGIRGIRNVITLPLSEKSILLYGDNGSGKSSVSDSIEWFYTDKVSHLSSQEIDLKDALRNSYLDINDESSVLIDYNKTNLNATKKLFYKKDKLVQESSNLSDDEFKKYYTVSQNENLLLRYQLLREFIDKPKSEKLTYLSGIIGFSEVTKTKEILRKVLNSVKTEMKSQNFEGQINTQKQILIEKIGAAVSQEENLFDRLNEITKPLKTEIIIKSITDIDDVLNSIKKPTNTKQITELQFLENINKTFINLKNEINLIDKEYQKYFLEFNKIAEDVQAIMQTFLTDLLKSASNVLVKKHHKENTCPLCLQPINIEDLSADIQKRLKEIEESSKKKYLFDIAKQTVNNIAAERIKRLDILLENPLLKELENQNIKQTINNLKLKMSEYQKAAGEKVTSGNKLPESNSLILLESDFSIQSEISTRIKNIQTAINKDITTELYANISAAKDAFKNIKRFENNKITLEHQKNTLEIIYTEFVKRQKEGLECFINKFSSNINEYYQYMNPDESFQEIRIITMGEDDDLKGITIEYNYNGISVSPPQKYFSESHLNCFGISFFLASVIAFNKENKFIVFDDVISSFDSNHRKRFADLLFDKFSDYQIILLTHESEWFSYIGQIAKKKGWLLNEIKWTEDKGTHIEEKPAAN